MNRTEEPTQLSALHGYTQEPRVKAGALEVNLWIHLVFVSECQLIPPLQRYFRVQSPSQIHVQTIIKETLMSERQDFHILEQICSRAH